MKIWLHNDFKSHYANRLSNRQRIKVLEAIELFKTDPFVKELRNHALKGKWRRHRSISVDADLRIHYKEIEPDIIAFVAVGSHSQLYK